MAGNVESCMVRRCAKRPLATALAASAACVLAATAGATPDPGVYQARISGATPVVLNGTWRLTFGGGSFRITRNRIEAVGGFTSFRGDRITFDDWFGPFRCMGAQKKGTYRWRLQGTTLTFVVVSDRCAGRKTILRRVFKKLS
jgi:hypothetical protein